MKRVLAFDLPVRLFHWIFTILFVTALVIANTVDDDSPTFSYHMMAGMTLGFVLFLRIIWGFIGSTYARFNSFMVKPSQLIGYFKEMFRSSTKRYLNHNPASSIAALVMFICVIGLGLTGYRMTTGAEGIKDVHEFFAQLFVVTAIAHIIGVVYHQVRHRDGMITSMFDGKKDAVDGQKPIESSRNAAGFIFLLLTIGFIWFLNSNFDSTTRTLDVFGTEILLGEHEESGDHDRNRERDRD